MEQVIERPAPDAIVVQVAPRELYRVATDVAGVCGEIVKRTAKKIQGRNHVGIEGWQAIATAHGCMLSIEEVKELECGDVTAIASVRRMSDGVMLTKAEGFVGSDEKMWMGRQRYARRAMAQTRAMSRAARSAFAHVVVMIDTGLSTTPAEEMPGHDESPETPAPPRRVESKTAPAPDPLEDNAKFLALLDEALAGREFTAEDRIAIKAKACKQAKVEDLADIPLNLRGPLISAVVDGLFNKKQAATAAGK